MAGCFSTQGDSDGAQGDDDHVNTEPTAKRHRAEEAEGGKPDDDNQLVPAASREKQLSAEEGGGEGRSSGGEKSEVHEEVAEDSMRAMSRKRKREEEEEEKDKERKFSVTLSRSQSSVVLVSMGVCDIVDSSKIREFCSTVKFCCLLVLRGSSARASPTNEVC